MIRVAGTSVCIVCCFCLSVSSVMDLFLVLFQVGVLIFSDQRAAQSNQHNLMFPPPPLYNPPDTSSESTASTSIREKILPRSISKHLNFSPRVLKLLPGFFMLLVCILTGSVFIKVDSPELTAAQCFYFSVITVTTIGYGDISPQTVGGKVFGIFYVLFACATVAQVLGAIAGSYIEARQEEARMKVLRKQITMEDFQKFDIDGDGQIEKTEFVVRKLMLMGLINLDDVELCEKEFDVMDIDGSGEITMEDLQSYITKQTDVANLRDQFVL